MKLIALLVGLAAATEPLPLHRDINATSVNVQDKRTEVVFFPDAESAIQKNIEQSPFYSCLNGEWDFLYFDSEKLVPEDLSAQKWEKIRYPATGRCRDGAFPSM